MNWLYVNTLLGWRNVCTSFFITLAEQFLGTSTNYVDLNLNVLASLIGLSTKFETLFGNLRHLNALLILFCLPIFSASFLSAQYFFKFQINFWDSHLNVPYISIYYEVLFHRSLFNMDLCALEFSGKISSVKELFLQQ